MPTKNASAMEAGDNSMEPGRLLTYRDCTVTPIRLTVPMAIKRPSGNPASVPITPKLAASPRNAASTMPRLAPSERTMPISGRLRTTETEMVL